MPHAVLLGDSVFDNSSYTHGGPDVVTQLRALLPSSWGTSLGAVDGHDALRCLPVLDAPMKDGRQALTMLGAVVAQFELQYVSALEECIKPGLPLVVCTIYNGCFDDAPFQRVATTFVALFNDVILRTASKYALPVVDLRAVCSEPGDYANPIEPSSAGGEKIARALAAVLTGDGLRTAATRVTLA